MPIRGGQVQELSRSPTYPGYGVPGEGGDPAVGQGVKVAALLPHRERRIKAPELSEDWTPSAPVTGDEGEAEVEEGFESASE